MKARVGSAALVEDTVDRDEKPNPLASIALQVAATAGSSGMTSSNPFSKIQLVQPPPLPGSAAVTMTVSVTEEREGGDSKPESSTATSTATNGATAGGSAGGFGAYSKISPFSVSSGSSFLTVAVPKSPGRVNPYKSPNSSASNPFMKTNGFWGPAVTVPGTDPSAPVSALAEAKSSNESGEKGKDDEEDGDGEAEDGYDPEAEVPITVGDSEPLFKPSADATALGNGEQGETCTFQMRAKLYRLDESKPAPRDDGSGESPSKSIPSASAASTVATAKATAQEWVEVGTGPLRVLTTKAEGEPLPSSRVVMRREAQAGGVGTKVILNVVLTKPVQICKNGPNMARLTCIDTSSSVGSSEAVRIISYLLKTKSAQVCIVLIVLINYHCIQCSLDMI